MCGAQRLHQEPEKRNQNLISLAGTHSKLGNPLTKNRHRKITMAAASFLAPPHLSIQSHTFCRKTLLRLIKKSVCTRAQSEQQEVVQEETEQTQQEKPEASAPQPNQRRPKVESLPLQPQAQNKNMTREYGGQWLSCTTRHIRIYAAYIDPITHVMDQTQMDKLTLILDPSNEFVWNEDTCQMVYSYFQELVDHYEVNQRIKRKSKL